jgi:argininosuccinate synthase
MMKQKVVLAFSGGLDTSVMLTWLKHNYDFEIVTYTADLGQGEEVELARKKALAFGVKPENIFVEDLRDQFVNDFVVPAYKANVVYEGHYLLGTPIARPLIARQQIEIAKRVGASSVAHGATGKGNDQVRFELSYYALMPNITVIAPWREWSLKGRREVVQYAQQHGIDVAVEDDGEPPYSRDANLLHITAEGKELEDPWATPSPDVFAWTLSPEAAPDKATIIEIGFAQGVPCSLDGNLLSPRSILEQLNAVGSKNAIGRVDIVDSRSIGMKSRGIFETPGGTIWQAAHRALESITLDREEIRLRDEIVAKYASLIYSGYWFSPEREMLQALIDLPQRHVTGTVRLKLYKGNVIVEGRKSPLSLYNADLVTFERDDVFNPKDSEGFIRINALRLKLLNQRNGKPQ